MLLLCYAASQDLLDELGWNLSGLTSQRSEVRCLGCVSPPEATTRKDLRSLLSSKPPSCQKKSAKKFGIGFFWRETFFRRDRNKIGRIGPNRFSKIDRFRARSIFGDAWIFLLTIKDRFFSETRIVSDMQSFWKVSETRERTFEVKLGGWKDRQAAPNNLYSQLLCQLCPHHTLILGRAG